MTIRSQAIKDAAQGAPCSARFDGICNFDPATTVWCHMNGVRFGKGTGGKAHDVCGFDGCSSCHEYFDHGHATHPVLSPGDFHMAVLGAVLESYVRRINLGIITVPQDQPTPAYLRKPKPPRKPKGERTPVQQPSKTVWAKRPMRSANNLRRKETSR